MAKTLYITDDPATFHKGTNDAKLNAATSWWLPQALSESRGNATGTTITKTVTTVAGATSGVEVGSGTVASEWISEPLSADFTISGTITVNLWMAESSNSANAAANLAVDKIDGATGAITRIATTVRTTEMPLTTPVAANFTVTPTSTACKHGDRLRVRVFADDSTTMGAGFTVTFWYDRNTGGVQGDSFITFTENLTFEPLADPGVMDQTVRGNAPTVGQISGNQRIAVQFTPALTPLMEVRAWLSVFGGASDNLIVEIQSDSAGSPSGSVIATVATVAAASLTGTAAQFTWTGSWALTPGTPYWLVFSRSGALNDSAFFAVDSSPSNAVSGWLNKSFTGSWATSNQALAVRLAFSISTYYLTSTAETINPGAATELKALTTPGGSSVTRDTSTITGPAAPIQIGSNTSGSIEWYTPPLQAFTLGGKAKFNIRALESAIAANASLKAEIAIVANDGTTPVVWGLASIEALTTNGSAGELGTTDAAYEAWVSGDDTAVTLNQRLRFRIFVDDCGDAPLASGSTVTTSYNGSTAGAAGDTFVMLPALVTEVVTSVPSLVLPMRASRNVLLRR